MFMVKMKFQNIFKIYVCCDISINNYCMLAKINFNIFVIKRIFTYFYRIFDQNFKANHPPYLIIVLHINIYKILLCLIKTYNFLRAFQILEFLIYLVHKVAYPILFVHTT